VCCITSFALGRDSPGRLASEELQIRQGFGSACPDELAVLLDDTGQQWAYHRGTKIAATKDVRKDVPKNVDRCVPECIQVIGITNSEWERRQGVLRPTFHGLSVFINPRSHFGPSAYWQPSVCPQICASALPLRGLLFGYTATRNSTTSLFMKAGIYDAD
jgi:hypothetical protein